VTRPSSMLSKVEKYLQLRRSLGYQLRAEGPLLLQFAKFADSTMYMGPLTTELALRWARLPTQGDRLYWARRLEIVRCFARHLSAIEPDTEVPSRNLLGPAHRRTTPHIYSDAELSALIYAAGRLRPSLGLRPKIYSTLIGLLACTGLRISEALHLNRVDADLDRGILTIRETKFRKTRLVPLHPTTVAVLQDYTAARQRLTLTCDCDRFFVSDKGQPMPYSTVRHVFRDLCKALKIMGTGTRRPRLHDLRHTFACRRLEQWYEDGKHPDRYVGALSVYLGHAKVSDTYWYLTATPALLTRAASRFEALAPRLNEKEDIQ
jgi:integrase